MASLCLTLGHLFNKQHSKVDYLTSRGTLDTSTAQNNEYLSFENIMTASFPQVLHIWQDTKVETL